MQILAFFNRTSGPKIGFTIAKSHVIQKSDIITVSKVKSDYHIDDTYLLVINISVVSQPSWSIHFLFTLVSCKYSNCDGVYK